MGIAPRRRALGVDRFIAAPPARVWRLLIDVQAWPTWGPSVRRAELADGGSVLSQGARGTVWTVAGVRMPFAITEFVPEHRWSWTVSGIPATGHELVVADGGCRVRFEVPWWAPAYLGVCALGLSRLAERAQAPQ